MQKLQRQTFSILFEFTFFLCFSLSISSCGVVKKNQSLHVTQNFFEIECVRENTEKMLWFPYCVLPKKAVR